EAEQLRGQPKPRSPQGWGLLLALWYLTFYRPILTEGHLRRKNLEFIFIRFSAWQYSGCDKLWAGLVTTLCDSIRGHFGALPLSLYHVLGVPPGYASGFGRQEWELKKGTCLKLWGSLLALAAGLAAVLIALLAPGLREHHQALKAVGGAVASVSGSGLALGACSVLKNLVVSEKRKIERLANSRRFANQLGFMGKVRGEVEALVDFLAFMEVFERRRLRVVLEITSLELCLPEKVAGVLAAMGTLLADAHAPFIFLLAVDPGVIVPCLEQTGSMKGLADNGYLYLNRVVTLPFSIPAMGARSKLRCLRAAVGTREDLLYRLIASNLGKGRRPRRVGTEVPTPWQEIDAQAGACILQAFDCLQDANRPLARYLPTDGAHLRRIVNTIPITLRLLLHRARGSAPAQRGTEPGTEPGTELGTVATSPLAAAAWVVLADQWPCRLSWALQCLEDAWQGGLAREVGARSLWSLYQENLAELSALRQPLHNLLSLDGDPELFHSFLAFDFPFGASHAHELLPVTVNLDHSIRHRMGLLRGLNRLQGAVPTPRCQPEPDPHRA
ncbi:NKPD1 protein, partial [Eubucco bourcierii]|nr:NKPD1 protein [Eubucco bourcierii]